MRWGYPSLLGLTWVSGRVAKSCLVPPDGVACVPTCSFLSMKRLLITFSFPGTDTFTLLLLELNWPLRTSGLGSERSADFVCLFDFGTWLSVPKQVYNEGAVQWLWCLQCVIFKRALTLFFIHFIKSIQVDREDPPVPLRLLVVSWEHGFLVGGRSLYPGCLGGWGGCGC